MTYSLKELFSVRPLLLAGLLFLLCREGHAQEFRFGIQTNPGLAWVSADNPAVASNGVRFSFDFGLVFDYVFGEEERYAFNSGINLLVSGANLKGTRTDTSGSVLTSTATAKVNYVEIPLTIKLRSNQVGYFTFYGQIGMVPAFAFRSRADYEYESPDGGGGVMTTSESNVKFDDVPFYPNTIAKVRPFNLGLHTEAGMEYDFTENTALVIGLYFNTGFMDMFKDNDGERIVSRNMGLRVGVLF